MLENTIEAIKKKFGKAETPCKTTDEREQDAGTVAEDTDTAGSGNTATTGTTLKATITRLFAILTPLAVAGGSYFGFEASQVTEIVTEVGVIITGIIGIWFAVKK